MMTLGKSDFQRKNKHKACRYFVYTQHALFYLLCLPLFSCPKLPDACRENDILIKSSWYPSNVLMLTFSSDILGHGSWYPQINWWPSNMSECIPQRFCWYPRILEHPRCFLMIPSENYFSENSDPQRFFILRQLWWHPQSEISISFHKWHPPKCPILSFESVAMLFIFL